MKAELILCDFVVRNVNVLISHAKPGFSVIFETIYITNLKIYPQGIYIRWMNEKCSSNGEIDRVLYWWIFKSHGSLQTCNEAHEMKYTIFIFKYLIRNTLSVLCGVHSKERLRIPDIDIHDRVEARKRERKWIDISFALGLKCVCVVCDALSILF